jgi:hypothetical protein
MFFRNCSISVLFLIVSSLFSFQLESIRRVILEDNFKVVGLTLDETGNYYILDSTGRVSKINENGETTAELKPGDADFVAPNAISYSGGWVYISDISRNVIYLYDRYLTNSLTVSLEFDALTIRPDAFSVSSDGTILIYDSQKNSLFLLSDINSRNITQLIIPQRDKIGENSLLVFDKLEKEFLIVCNSNLLIYNSLGIFQRDIEPQDSNGSQIISAFTTNLGFAKFYNNSILLFTGEKYDKIESVTDGIILQEISGFIVIYNKNELTTYKIVE